MNKIPAPSSRHGICSERKAPAMRKSWSRADFFASAPAPTAPEQQNHRPKKREKKNSRTPTPILTHSAAGWLPDPRPSLSLTLALSCGEWRRLPQAPCGGASLPGHQAMARKARSATAAAADLASSVDGDGGGPGSQPAPPSLLGHQAVAH